MNSSLIEGAFPVFYDRRVQGRIMDADGELVMWIPPGLEHAEAVEYVRQYSAGAYHLLELREAS